MLIYLKEILLFCSIILVVAMIVAVIQIILMLLDIRWVSHELKKRAQSITEIYDAIVLLGGSSWKVFVKRIRKMITNYFNKHYGGDDDGENA